MAWLTTQAAAIEAIRDALRLRPVIIATETAVYAEPQNDWHDIIQFNTSSLTQAYDSIGNQRQVEEYTLPVTVGAKRKGAGEAVAKEARDASVALVNEINYVLGTSPTLGGIVHKARLTGAEIQAQGAEEGSRFCVWQVTISVTAYLTR